MTQEDRSFRPCDHALDVADLVFIAAVHGRAFDLVAFDQRCGFASFARHQLPALCVQG